MFQVGNLPILASEMEVLLELKQQLEWAGISLFAKFKRSGANIQFNCPIHAGGQEQRPSCGITIEGGEAPPGLVHCFACGYSATLEEMISHCFGYDDMGRFGRDWLIKNFVTVAIENREDLQLDLGRTGSEVKIEYVSEEELESYRFYHPYMWQRGFTPEVVELFDVGYDKKTNSLTFPVRDSLGRTLFVGRRRVDQKFFHYPKGVNKPVYGVYEIPKEVTEVIICESFIDALTCYVYGKPAFALLGTGNRLQYEHLMQLPYRKYILAFDGDDAGRRADERFRRNVKGKIITTLELPEGKDVNDLSLEEFQNLKEYF